MINPMKTTSDFKSSLKSRKGEIRIGKNIVVIAIILIGTAIFVGAIITMMRKFV
tara:strand:+ start:47 stop:208 length:162 start_codon:yes stop_codon:yes gene_type:complete